MNFNQLSANAQLMLSESDGLGGCLINHTVRRGPIRHRKTAEALERAGLVRICTETQYGAHSRKRYHFTVVRPTTLGRQVLATA